MTLESNLLSGYFEIQFIQTYSVHKSAAFNEKYYQLFSLVNPMTLLIRANSLPYH